MDEQPAPKKTSKRIAGRRRVGYLTGELKDRLVELFQQCCSVQDWGLLELNVQPDHVHMLIQLPPKESVSLAVKLLKGGSSRVLAIEFPDLEEYIWKSGFWSDGFFAESVGMKEEEMIRRYIRDQGSKRDKVTKLK